MTSATVMDTHSAAAPRPRHDGDQRGSVASNSWACRWRARGNKPRSAPSSTRRDALAELGVEPVEMPANPSGVAGDTTQRAREKTADRRSGGHNSTTSNEPECPNIEAWFERGVTDGLPVVPPSRARVDATLATTRRERGALVAEVPPNFGRATVEKLAVNAVMAGCRPDYFPVVLAAVEAACDPAFNLHGQSGTTNAASPLIIVNGPVRKRLDVNCAAGVLSRVRATRR